MKCRELDELLSAYSDGELPETQKEFVEAHLTGCSDCRATMEKYSTVRQQILSLRQVPVMKELKASILTKAGERRTARRLKNWLPPAAVRISISGALLAALAIGLIGRFNNGGDGDFWNKVEAASQNLSAFRMTQSMGSYADAGVDLEITYNQPDIYDYKFYNYHYFTSPISVTTGRAPSTTKPTLIRTLAGVEEIVTIGNRVYVQTPETKGLNFSGSDAPKHTPPEKPQSIQDIIDGVSWFTTLTQLSDEKIDGITCTHFLGTYNTVNLWQKIVDSLDPQDPRYEMDSSTLANEIKTGGVDVQEDLWISKKDYLLREIKDAYIDPVAITSGISIRNYYYDNVHVTMPVKSSGATFPGWYQVTDSLFTSSLSFDYSESGQHTLILDVELTNSGQQKATNIQVFSSFEGALIYKSNQTSGNSLSPGQTQTYTIPWDLWGITVFNKTLENIRVFVEYSTRDGVNHVQVLNPAP